MKPIGFLLKLLTLTLAGLCLSLPLYSAFLSLTQKDVINTAPLNLYIASVAIAVFLVYVIWFAIRKHKILYVVCTIALYAGAYALTATVLKTTLSMVSFVSNSVVLIAGGAGMVLFVLAAAYMSTVEQKLNRIKRNPMSIPVVTSRDTDKVLSENKNTRPVETFVKDPWGNLIPKSAYDKHAEEMKNKKL